MNVFIANAPGCHESIISGDPQRVSPISAWRRAMSVETCSGEGSGRVSSENWTMRAGVGSTATVTRSMAAAGGFDSRSSSASVRSVRASRIGTGNCSDRSCTSRVVPSVLIKMQSHVQHGRAAIALLQVRLERLHQTAEHERQRLELLDRPFELERLLESLFGHGRHQRTRVLSTRETLPVCVLTAKTCREIVGRQCREIAERSQTPAAETAVGELGVRGDWDVGVRDSGFDPASPSRAIGSGATAAASLPGSTIVSPARYRTSNRAAVRVPAIATRTRNPRSAAVRRSSSAIVRASPNNRVRPFRSSTISVGLHTSMRGENSRATSASTSRLSRDSAPTRLSAAQYSRAPAQPLQLPIKRSDPPG